jgi:hypothetical protein
VLVPEERADSELLQSWLRGVRGGPVDISVPQRVLNRRTSV